MATTAVHTQGRSGIDISLRRVIGLMGIIGVITFFVVIFGIEGEPPGTADPASEARAWWADKGTQYLVGDYIGGIALVLFILPFVLGLYGILSRAEGSDPLGARAALAGFILFLVVASASGLSAGALALSADQIESDGTIRALQYMEFYSFGGGVPLTAALFLGGASFAIARTKVMWRWLVWFGVPLAIAGVVGAAAPIDGDPESALAGVGLIASGGFFLWILAAAINVFMSRTMENS